MLVCIGPFFYYIYNMGPTKKNEWVKPANDKNRPPVRKKLDFGIPAKPVVKQGKL